MNPTSTTAAHHNHSSQAPSHAIHEQRRRAAAFSAALAAVVSIRTLETPDPTPMRTSILTGRLWLKELREGHPGHFYEQFGMSKGTFQKLKADLQQHYGLRDSKYVDSDEQLSIFLYLASTGSSIRMLQERFQHSGDTVSKCVVVIFLFCFCFVLLIELLKICAPYTQYSCRFFLQALCVSSWRQDTYRDCKEPKILPIFSILPRWSRWISRWFLGSWSWYCTLSQSEGPDFTECTGSMWLWSILSLHSQRMGRKRRRLSGIWLCAMEGLHSSSWTILPCWCWISALWCSHDPVSWCKISPKRVGTF